jgi:hypothetical protein
MVRSVRLSICLSVLCLICDIYPDWTLDDSFPDSNLFFFPMSLLSLALRFRI